MNDLLGVQVLQPRGDLVSDLNLLLRRHPQPAAGGRRAQAAGGGGGVRVGAEEGAVEAAVVAHREDEADGGRAGGGGREVDGRAEELDEVGVLYLDEDAQLEDQVAHLGLDGGLAVLGLADLLYRHLPTVVDTAINFAEAAVVNRRPALNHRFWDVARESHLGEVAELHDLFAGEALLKCPVIRNFSAQF